MMNILAGSGSVRLTCNLVLSVGGLVVECGIPRDVYRWSARWRVAGNVNQWSCDNCLGDGIHGHPLSTNWNIRPLVLARQRSIFPKLCLSWCTQWPDSTTDVYVLCWTEYFGCINISARSLAETAKSGITLRRIVRLRTHQTWFFFCNEFSRTDAVLPRVLSKRIPQRKTYCLLCHPTYNFEGLDPGLLSTYSFYTFVIFAHLVNDGVGLGEPWILQFELLSAWPQCTWISLAVRKNVRQKYSLSSSLSCFCSRHKPVIFSTVHTPRDAS